MIISKKITNSKRQNWSELGAQKVINKAKLVQDHAFCLRKAEAKYLLNKNSKTKINACRWRIRALLMSHNVRISVRLHMHEGCIIYTSIQLYSGW